MSWFHGLEAEAQGFFPHACAHGWDHVMRVRGLAMHIARAESADLEVVDAAALLHDIGRGGPHDASEGHAAASAQLAEITLDRRDCPPGERAAIIAAIRDHSYAEGCTPASLEGRILQDADRLDACGAVGIARAFMRAGEQGRAMDTAVAHFHDKLLRLGEGMHTPTARRIAEERHEVLVRFLEDLTREARESSTTSL